MRVPRARVLPHSPGPEPQQGVAQRPAASLGGQVQVQFEEERMEEPEAEASVAAGPQARSREVGRGVFAGRTGERV